MYVQRSRARTLRASPQLRRTARRDQYRGRHQSRLRRRIAAGRAHRERPHCRRAIPHARMQGRDCQRFAADRADRRQNHRRDSRHHRGANLAGARRIACGHSPRQPTRRRRAGRTFSINSDSPCDCAYCSAVSHARRTVQPRIRSRRGRGAALRDRSGSARLLLRRSALPALHRHAPRRPRALPAPAGAASSSW